MSYGGWETLILLYLFSLWRLINISCFRQNKLHNQRALHTSRFLSIFNQLDKVLWVLVYNILSLDCGYLILADPTESVVLRLANLSAGGMVPGVCPVWQVFVFQCNRSHFVGRQVPLGSRRLVFLGRKRDLVVSRCTLYINLVFGR